VRDPIRRSVQAAIDRKRDAFGITGVAESMRSPFNKYYKAYRAARKAAGRPDLRPHDLRHSLPFQIIFSGGTLSDVQAALHHKSVIASNRYAHLYPEWVERAISRPQKCPPRALIRSRKTGRRWRKPFKLVPGAGVEPARRNYPSRDFKSLVSTSFTTRAVTLQNCVRRKLEAGVGIEPASTALQAAA